MPRNTVRKKMNLRVNLKRLMRRRTRRTIPRRMQQTRLWMPSRRK